MSKADFKDSLDFQKCLEFKCIFFNLLTGLEDILDEIKPNKVRLVVIYVLEANWLTF